ncbi:hypothetical protein ASD45_09965 [Pseudolabrys sp. Root1462]|nr:hypothetical protein ASD45_09965 [Pseudolabrys sp. Root1462]
MHQFLHTPFAQTQRLFEPNHKSWVHSGHLLAFALRTSALSYVGEVRSYAKDAAYLRAIKTY